MADNVTITEGTGTTVATDQIGTVHYQEVKLINGTKDSTTPIAVDVGVKANALRVAPANDITDATYIGDIKFGEAEPNSAAILADTTAILADTAAIQTAVELLDNAVDGNYLNVNLNAAGTDLSMNAGVLTAQTMRVTIATDDEVNNLLGTIDADTSTMNTNIATMVGDTTSIDGKITACNTGAVVLAAGSAAIGKLAANTGVDIGDVDVTSIVPGTAATNLGKAEDAIHATGDVGVMALAVRDDAPSAATAAEGDYTPLLTNATGQLYVIDPTNNALVTTGNASLATVASDTTSLDGKVTACNTGAVVLSSGTVTTVSTVTNLAQMGGAALNMGEGTISTGTQRVTIATDDDGVAHLATIAGDTTNIETAIQIIDDWDATHASAAPADGAQVMGAAYSTALPTDVGADADAARLVTDRYGRLCTGLQPQATKAVTNTADCTTAVAVVAAVATRRIFITSLILSVDTAGNYWLEDGDAAAVTGKFYLAANGGVAITFPEGTPLNTVTQNKALNVKGSTAGNVSVTVTYYLAV